MSYKRRFVLLAVWLSLCLFLFYMIYGKAKEKTITELNTRQMIHARQAKKGIETYIDNWLAILRAAAEKEHVITLDDFGKEWLAFLLSSHKDKIRAVTRVGADGKIIHTIPYEPESIGADISSQKHIQEIMRTKRPVMSDVFTAVQGYAAIALHVPVFKDRKFRGTLGVLLDFQKIARQFLEVIQIGDTGYAWMISAQGIEMYCSVPGHVGKSVTEISRNSPGVPAMVQEMLKGNSGITAYHINQIQAQRNEKDKKLAIYLPVNVVNTFWSLVVASSEKEALASLDSFRDWLVVVIGILFIGSVLFAYFAMRAWGIVKEEKKRKRAEEMLRESEEKYKILAESSQTGIYVHQDDIIVFANERFAELHGYTAQELIGMNYFDLFHPEEREKAQAVKLKRLAGGDAPRHRYFRRIRKDGSILWCDAVAICIEYQGKPAIMGNILDITDRKQAEEILLENEEKYRHLFEMESDVIVLVRQDDGQILEINAAGTKLYGYLREEFLKMENTDLSAEPEKTRKATREGRPKIPLRYHRKKDGTVFPVEISGSQLRWKGQDARIETIRDISERMEAEKEKTILNEQLRQSQKMEAIGTLSGGVAHDFNNILAIIIGNTEMAMDEVPEWNPAREYLDEILSASLRARDVVRQILSFSRKTVTDRKPLRIYPIVEDSLKMLRASIPADIDIRQNISCVSDMILADPTQISQILMNLCANAAHAMRGGGGILEIGLRNVELGKQNLKSDLPPGCYVRLSVSDTGHGIDPENIERIFDPYFTTAETGEGTGLGLSVVQGIVKTHHGQVMVKSEPGKGAVFEVLLPVIEGELEAEAAGLETSTAGNENILFIDDEISILKLIKRRLETKGYHVETESNPIEALARFRSSPDRFDLIITDMTMPNLTGDRLAKEILTLRPKMPIMLCSGYSNRIDAEKAAALGIRKYIEKPLNMSDFMTSVRNVLDETKR